MAANQKKIARKYKNEEGEIYYTYNNGSESTWHTPRNGYTILNGEEAAPVMAAAPVVAAAANGPKYVGTIRNSGNTDYILPNGSKTKTKPVGDYIFLEEGWYFDPEDNIFKKFGTDETRTNAPLQSPTREEEQWNNENNSPGAEAPAAEPAAPAAEPGANQSKKLPEAFQPLMKQINTLQDTINQIKEKLKPSTAAAAGGRRRRSTKRGSRKATRRVSKKAKKTRARR
jgi:hypothetical protein